MVHHSFLNENPEAGSESNERLEFLGDAILGFVVADRLFRTDRKAPEGELTIKRSQVVRGASLARAARRLGLGDSLLMGRGEAASGGGQRGSNLADALEAVIGAVFLDRGYRAAYQFVERTLAVELAAASIPNVPKDPKNTLQELLQADGVALPRYRVATAGGPDLAREFTVEVLVAGEVAASGSGRRKLDAERDAARTAIQRLGERRKDGGPPL